MSDLHIRFLVDLHEIYHEQYSEFVELLKDEHHHVDPLRQFDDFFDICVSSAGMAVVDMADVDGPCPIGSDLLSPNTELMTDITADRLRCEFSEYAEEASDMYWSLREYSSLMDRINLYASVGELCLITTHLILGHVLHIMHWMPQTQWLFDCSQPNTYPKLIDHMELARAPRRTDARCGLRFCDEARRPILRRGLI